MSALKGRTVCAERGGKYYVRCKNKKVHAYWIGIGCVVCGSVAELRELRLNASIGDDYEYLIPTLEEVLQVCKERTTIRLDKFSMWDWDTDIYPLIQKTGAWRTCILSEFHSTEKQEEIISTIKAESGMDVLRFYTLKHEKASE